MNNIDERLISLYDMTRYFGPLEMGLFHDYVVSTHGTVSVWEGWICNVDYLLPRPEPLSLQRMSY